MYGNTNNDDSLPDPFGSQDTKKLKKSDTKEVQAKEKLHREAMDTSDMLELISDDEEEQPKGKKFSTKKHPVRKPQKHLSYLFFQSIKIQNLLAANDVLRAEAGLSIIMNTLC